ncbi:MAG: hypothetical protein RIC14_00060 [Filomicrobium sp.]
MIFAACFALAGCSDSYEERLDRLPSYVTGGGDQISTGYWLVRNRTLTPGGPDRIAFVFGLTDNGGFCQEIADLYAKIHSSNLYSCVEAQ